MRIVKLNDIRHESGHCYLSGLGGLDYPGEGVGQPRKSDLMVFENGVQLGPASSSHDRIRTIGGGAFSHWGNQLYFSASDSSRPVANGREYACLVPESLDEERDLLERLAFSHAADARFLNAVLSGSLSTQGAELHSAFTLRCLLLYCSRAGVAIEGKSCLEVGASPSNGLAISLGLLGARKVALNNIAPIPHEVDASFARSVAFLTGLIAPVRRTLEEVADLSADGRTCRLKPEIFTFVGGTDALRLPEFVSDIELIFSFSVLEHIRHLPQVMRALRKLAASDCVSIHAIDTRDHTDFANPLKFLYLSQEQFDASYSEEHNRWRFPDYLKILSRAGWEVVSEYYMGALPVLDNGNTDMMKVASLGPERMLFRSAAELPHIISPEEIRKLDPPFRRFTPEDLSVLVLAVVAKPAL